MTEPWWLVPAWLDEELRRYLAACDEEVGGEDMAYPGADDDRQDIRDREDDEQLEIGERLAEERERKSGR